MTVRIGHVKAQHDIERITRAARINVTTTHDRVRSAFAVDARTEADAQAFRDAAERIGLGDEIS